MAINYLVNNKYGIAINSSIYYLIYIIPKKKKNTQIKVKCKRQNNIIKS